MISFGIATLPTSWSSAPNSAARRVSWSTPMSVGDRDGELDHVLGVLAGVGVVGLDHVAEQQRGAAVGAGQLDRLLDARGALAGEDREQPGERDHEQHGVRLIGGGEGRQQADREEQGVDAVGHGELAEDGAGILAQAGPHARDVDHAVERDHGDERADVDGPVAPVRRLGAAHDEHRRGGEREPGVGDREQGAVAGDATAERVDQRGDDQGERDQQRHRRRREQQQHRHQDHLRRDREPRARRELRPRDERVGGDQRHGEARVELAIGRREPGERDRADQEAERERAVGELLAREQPLGPAREGAFEEPLGPGADLGVGWH